MKFEDFLIKHVVKIAFFLITIGLLVIGLFMCIAPFNDWSTEVDPNLFGQYGSFIGGFAGSLFSLAGFFLLYKTLIAQQETLKNQKDDSVIQKEAIDKERFETTFFNLLNVQQNITDKIKANFWTIIELDKEKIVEVSGRDFFLHSKIELTKINQSIFSDKYLGSYDEESIGNYYSFFDQIRDPYCPNYKEPKDREKEIFRTYHNISIQYVNKFYGITKFHWASIKEENNTIKIKYVYELFFLQFHFAIGHYFRNLYHILKFIEIYENRRIENYKGNHELKIITENCTDNKWLEIITEDCKKYAQFIQAQMSSYELTLLYYNALCFPKALELIKKYGVLDNLCIEDLINANHYDENIIKLKKREELIDFDAN